MGAFGEGQRGIYEELPEEKIRNLIFPLIYLNPSGFFGDCRKNVKISKLTKIWHYCGKKTIICNDRSSNYIAERLSPVIT